MRKYHVESELIHIDDNFSEETGAVTAPIFLTSTFASGNPGNFDYTRSGNPNFRNLSAAVALLENAEHASVFASGVSAMTAILANGKSGMKIAAESNLYGCTIRLFDRVFKNFGVESCYLDFRSDSIFDRLDRVRPDMIWIESPTNPCMKVLDIRTIGDYCKANGICLVVDNTFASSAAQRPLDLGATLSLQSLTKYACGHSDVLAGAVATNCSEWHEKLEFSQKALGLQPSPMDAWLVSRGLKTYQIRMKAHSESALALASELESNRAFSAVHYPWLESHPDYELAKNQMKLGSGVVSVELNGSEQESLQFLSRLKLFTKAESLGGVESLVCHPFTMTHASVPVDIKLSAGVTRNLIRFSVGLENVRDLIDDVYQALPDSVVERSIRSQVIPASEERGRAYEEVHYATRVA